MMELEPETDPLPVMDPDAAEIVPREHGLPGPPLPDEPNIADRSTRGQGDRRATLTLPRTLCARTAADAHWISVLTYISRSLYRRGVHAFDVLGDPVRRRILELLADGELTVRGDHGDRPGRVRHLAAGRLAAPQGPARQRLRDGPARGRAAALRRRRGTVPRARRLARPLPPVLGPAARLARDRARPRQARASPRRRRPTRHRKETAR